MVQKFDPILDIFIVSVHIFDDGSSRPLVRFFSSWSGNYFLGIRCPDCLERSLLRGVGEDSANRLLSKEKRFFSDIFDGLISLPHFVVLVPKSGEKRLEALVCVFKYFLLQFVILQS